MVDVQKSVTRFQLRNMKHKMRPKIPFKLSNIRRIIFATKTSFGQYWQKGRSQHMRKIKEDIMDVKPCYP